MSIDLCRKLKKEEAKKAKSWKKSWKKWWDMIDEKNEIIKEINKYNKKSLNIEETYKLKKEREKFEKNYPYCKLPDYKYIMHNKLFVCKICDKRFITSKNLTKHRNAHKKLFICVICNKQLTTNFGLKLHMRTHTGKK